MFYEQLKKACEKVGVKMTPLVIELGLSRSLVTSWKNGVVPTGEVLKKLADRLGVSVDYLLDRDQTSAPSEDDIKVALFGGEGEVTDEMWQEVKNFAEYVKNKNKDKDDN